ncbi:Xin actin-binding repeat-containing protein 2 [Dissostichus eleginoides]|uniref:Xin actin-binding repeat-containing protein 2 n=1 Tax=Dissostichus eleginoides TaxID=100907 RepID=A0AAD9BNE2_DISEL|nr:Xin actin-binding repeat-containing protein 2 [Dissostichus eleginoides]
MSDSGVNPHLEGIISDFEALKRSFEVEDVDTSSHLSPGSRRTTSSPHRNAMSPTSIYYRDLGTPPPPRQPPPPPPPTTTTSTLPNPAPSWVEEAPRPPSRCLADPNSPSTSPLPPASRLIGD